MTFASDEPALPNSVKRVSLDGREIYLVATAHVSPKSVEDVRQAFEQVRPDSVCVELCRARYRNLTDREQWRRTTVVKIIREGKVPLLLTSLIMTSFQRRIGQRLGVVPGAEMRAAADAARKADSTIVLADRDIQVTLKRTWSNLAFRDKLRLMTHALASLFAIADIDEADIEEIKQEENVADILQIMADEFPQVKMTLIDERDKYLAQKIREAPGEKVLAVVGAGHVPGILREIKTSQSLPELEKLPPPLLWPQVLKWAVPAVIVSLFVAGFYRGGIEHSLGSVYIWVLLNGTLAALGAALALGHPLTVASAFLVAPLTSLNPLMAAGWVAGLVQAFIKKPTVRDLENLPDAITSVKGFWLNPVSRVLLVVVLSNLGSSLGTFVSGSWIVARWITLISLL